MFFAKYFLYLMFLSRCQQAEGRQLAHGTVSPWDALPFHPGGGVKIFYTGVNIFYTVCKNFLHPQPDQTQ